MSKNKDVTMGLPRLSGKRNWSEVDGGRDTNVPSKVLCTSPPHAICAEDVPQNSPPSNSHTANMESCKSDDEKEVKSILTSDQDGYDHLSESDDDNFIDDEEDKDSGFIDGNSIDNSSDDDDSKENTFSTPSTTTAAFASFGSHVNFTSETSIKSSVMESLNESMVHTVDSSILKLTTVTTSSQSSIEPKMSISESFSTFAPTFINTITLSTSIGTTFADSKVLDTSTTTAASTLTGTVVTNTYQGSVSSLSYDLHPYPCNLHPADPYFHRPGTPAWSCNFYDGSHPSTNKYMEISPNRSLPSQSIQCDENGKSYMELGSASPYNSTYSNNECTNFTTSPSTYQSSSYTTSFSGTNSFGPNSTYYNSRQSYSQNFSYGQNEPYNYENDNLCSYSYGSSYGNGLRGSNGILSRSLSRCTSPYCDPTKTSPRPACYNQQRLSVFNMSMFKLNRFNRFPEPNLHRSVLICNTLRHIEKEFETEGISMSAILASHNQAYGAQAPPHPPINESSNQNNGASLENLPSMSHSSSNNEGPLPSMHSPIVGATPLQLTPFSPSTTNQSPPSPSLSPGFNSSPHLTCQTMPYSPLTESNLTLENKDPLPSLRPYTQSPIPCSNIDSATDSESSSWPSRINISNREEKTEGINWCSVLSLSSQSDLDSVNNNECDEWSSEETIVLPYSANSESQNSSEKLPSLSADDVLKSFPETRRTEPTGEIDTLIKDMLGS